MELWFTEPHTDTAKFSIKVKKQLFSTQSEFQRIDVFDSEEFGVFLKLKPYNGPLPEKKAKQVEPVYNN